MAPPGCTHGLVCSVGCVQAIVDKVMSYHQSRSSINSLNESSERAVNLFDSNLPKALYYQPLPGPPILEEPHDYMLQSLTNTMGAFNVDGNDSNIEHDYDAYPLVADANQNCSASRENSRSVQLKQNVFSYSEQQLQLSTEKPKLSKTSPNSDFIENAAVERVQTQSNDKNLIRPSVTSELLMAAAAKLEPSANSANKTQKNGDSVEV